MKLECFDSFTFRVWRIPVYGDKENPYFRAVDVAKVIDYSAGNTRHMCDMVDPSEKILARTIGTGQVGKWGGNRTDEYFLTEYGLYEILFQSRKPIAKEFKQVVKYILKKIRLDRGGSFNIFDNMPVFDEDGRELVTGPGGQIVYKDEMEAVNNE